MKQTARHLFLAALLPVLALMAVSCGADRNIKRGEKYLALGEYYDAANEFRQAYQRTEAKNRDKRGDIARRMGYCYDRSLQTGKGIAAYRNAERYHRLAPADRLDMARLLLKNGSYREAEGLFQAVLDSLPGNTLALNGLDASRQAPAIREQGSRYTVRKMEVFNSRRAEYSPMLQGDNYELLYFTSTRNEAQGNELQRHHRHQAGRHFFLRKRRQRQVEQARSRHRRTQYRL